MNAQQQKSALEAKISKIAGHEVEITIRGERSFTFSFETLDKAAAQKITSFFGEGEIETDDELEMTFVYLN